MALADRITQRTASIGIVGLGYVGLPLAVAFARNGFRVVGFDVDRRKVDSLAAGISYVPDVASSAIQEFRDRFSATADSTGLAGTDIVFICVPTPFDANKTPNLSYIRSASEAILAILQPGQLVILQSTTFPGTTEEVVKPILESSGLVAGSDFWLAFSPERVDPGNTRWTVETTPKVVGGLTPACAELARQVLECITPHVHVVSSPRAAEATKLLENVFRSVNIALVNEMALLAERLGIDIWEVVNAAATKPFGFMPFYPGPGVGGHCIPVDPYYLSWKAREYDFTTHFIDLAAETNQAMPYHVVDLVTAALADRGVGLRGAKVVIAGVSFKPEVPDTRNAPSERVIQLLNNRGADIHYADPHVTELHIPGSALHPADITLQPSLLDADTIAWADCVVILVRHSGFDFAQLDKATLVVDTVNALGHSAPNIVRLGAPMMLPS